MSLSSDRRQAERTDRRKIIIALLASLLFHLLLILIVTVVVTSHLPPPPPPPKPPEQPAELTMIEAPTPTPKPAYVETTESQRAEKPPENAPFESDKDTLAAAERTATGQAPIPTQEGEKSPSLQFENRAYTSGKQPRPASPSAPPPKPQHTVPPPPKTRPMATPRPLSQLALLQPPEPKATPQPSQTPTPTPTPQPQQTPQPQTPQPPTPQQPQTRPSNPSAPGYQPQTRITRLDGSISNRGRSSVAARATPLGRYQKAISDAVGSRWYYLVSDQIELMNPGSLKVRFTVMADGSVQDLKILSNTSNESFASCSVSAIMKAEIPPMPKDLVPMLYGGRVEIDFSFTIEN